MLDQFRRGFADLDRVHVRQTGPQPLGLALRIVIDALAVLAAPALLPDHVDQEFVGVASHGVGQVQVDAALARHPVHQIDGHVVQQLQRAARHAGHAADVVDDGGRDALDQHLQTFADVGVEHAAGEEATTVVDDDRHLLQLLAVVQRLGQGLLRSGLADDDLDQLHPVDRREEVDANEVGRTLGRFRQAGDRQGRGVRGEHGVRPDLGLGALGHIGLQGAILEHGLDHQVGALDGVIVGGGGDAADQVVGGGLAHRALGHGLGDQGFRIGLALVGAGLGHVDQDGVDADARLGIGDARTHHAGAENGGLLDGVGRHVLGTGAALGQGLFRQKQRADHGPRLGRLLGVQEQPRLDPQGGIHRQVEAFIDAAGDVLLGRIVAVALGHDLGRRQDEARRTGVRIGAVRHGIALAVPRLDAFAAVHDPRLGGGQGLARFDHFIDDADGLGFGGVDRRAGQHQVERGLHARQTWHTLGAAGARQQADGHFRQADLGPGRGDAVVRRQRELEAAAERDALDGRRDRLADRLQRAKRPAHARGGGQRGFARRALGLTAGGLAQFAQEGGDAVGVHRNGEVVHVVVLTVRSRSDALDDGGGAHSGADAEGGQASRPVGALQLVQQGAEDHAAGGAQRVAHGDGAAVHVHPVVRHVQLLHEIHDHRGEGLVQLEQVDVADAHARAGQGLLRHGDRAGQHDGRLRTDRGRTDDAGAGLQPHLLAHLPGADQDAGGAVDDAGGVARVVHVVDRLDLRIALTHHRVEARRAQTRERGLQGAQRLDRGFRADEFVVVEHRHARVLDRDDRGLEAAGGPGGGGALLALGGEGVDVGAAEAGQGGDGVGADALGRERGGEGHVRVGRPGAAIRAHLDAAHALDAAADGRVRLAEDDLGRRRVHGLKPRGAEAVHLHARHRLGQACVEGGDAGDVGALLSDRRHAAQDDVVDQAGVEGVAVAQGLQHLGRQGDGGHFVQAALGVAPAARRARLIGVVIGRACVQIVCAPRVGPDALTAKAPDHAHQQGGAVRHGAVDHLPLPRRARRQNPRQHAKGQHHAAAAEVADHIDRRGRLFALAAESVQCAGDGDIVDVVAGGRAPNRPENYAGPGARPPNSHFPRRFPARSPVRAAPFGRRREWLGIPARSGRCAPACRAGQAPAPAACGRPFRSGTGSSPGATRPGFQPCARPASRRWRH
uniref:PE-PGRS family protein n=1 Tax=Parastrongyloides trichosuri TaxID=131310 RepID=A0A0N4Z3R5_PARTI